jgi:biopolymer transport protein ExbB/TolQ
MVQILKDLILMFVACFWTILLWKSLKLIIMIESSDESLSIYFKDNTESR